MPRSFAGSAGRPFGTVAALVCLILTAAAITLADVAQDLAGGRDPFEVIALGNAAMARSVWGLLLAGEIVRTVLGCFFALAVWTLARPIGLAGPMRLAALATGLAGAVLFSLASRQGIQAAAWLSDGRLSGWGDTVALGSRLAFLAFAAWIGLCVAAAGAANSLPPWVRLVGLVTAAALALAAFAPTLAWIAGYASLIWWGGVFLTLYKPEDRIAR